MQAQGTWSAGEADDKQRFLADLRALRDSAVLEWDELAARAHYPSDVLKEAQNGPTLPTLPILAAYVRACDGDVPEWEERWRRLGFDSRADDGLPVRSAGASPAAVAGARAGVSVAPPDGYDPERIRAALRGSHHAGRGAATWAASGRDTRGWASVTGPVASPGSGPGSATAEPRVPDSPASWNPGTSWDETTRWDADRSAETASGWDADAAGWSSAFHQDAGAVTGLNGTSGNGNHHVTEPGGAASDAMVIETPDLAQADAIRRDPFSAEWLRDNELTSAPDTESGWTDQAAAEPTVADADSWFTPRETEDREQTRPDTGTQPSPEDPDNWFTPRERADGGLALPGPGERDVEPLQDDTESTIIGFWTPSATGSAAAPASAPASVSGPAAVPAPAEVQRPGPPAAEDRTVPRASWTAPGESPAGDPPGAVSQTAAVPAQAAAIVPSRTAAEPAVPPGPAVPPNESRPDRLYQVRLLVVIVVAALIGSILVLLVR